MLVNFVKMIEILIRKQKDKKAIEKKFGCKFIIINLYEKIYMKEKP